jgi:hypothetical protein
VAAVRQGRALAMLELGSRRAAADHHARGETTARGRFTGEAPAPPALETVAPEPGMAEVVASLGAFGPVTPTALRGLDGLTIYLFLAPGMPAATLAGLAGEIFRAADAVADAFGPVRTIGLRVAGRHLVVRPVRDPGGRATVLVAAGGGVQLPGRAHLEVERAAALLAAR